MNWRLENIDFLKEGELKSSWNSKNNLNSKN